MIYLNFTFFNPVIISDIIILIINVIIIIIIVYIYIYIYILPFVS